MNNKYIQLSITFLLLFFAFLTPIFSQIDGYIPQSDTFCVQVNGEFETSVLDNDQYFFDGPYFVYLIEDSPCFTLNAETGFLKFRDGAEDCCGEHVLTYAMQGCEGADHCFATINITVKCEKPECFLVDLDDYIPEEGPAGTNLPPPCVYACENSESTYYVFYNVLSTYTWTIDGGIGVAGNNDAEVNVTWGAQGAGTITLTITDENGISTTIEVCAEILESPVADFEVYSSTVCLNSPVTFENNSTGGNDYFWDFGDGNSSSMFEPTHTYATAGTYTATLFVTRNNFDDQGNALCCCTDSISMEITIDPDEGPNIYCISTLCARDNAKYWTDATGCSSYNWTVLDENDVPMTFDGQGTDKICVQWGDGPFGTVILDVDGCDDSYCPSPTAIKVPIIPDVATINGATDVCEFVTETYTVSKWISVYYNWTVTGGTIVAGQGTNTVVIHWDVAGVGTIVLDYGSEFLSGLPIHDAPDCTGTATLSVNIKPQFEIYTPIPTTVCLGSTSNIFATSLPYGNYTWSISPAVIFTGQNSNNIFVTWDNGPGTYTITAVPNDLTVYCNDIVSVLIRVVEVPVPSGIDGEVEICPGDMYTYFGQTTEANVGFSWTVVGGDVASFTGDPLVVTWNAVGPYSIQLQQFQLTAPFCTSDAISLTVTPKEIAPLSITGVTAACINEVESYVGGAPQHPDATYDWTIIPSNLGSVINGQGTPNAEVQWNNDGGIANLIFTVMLCGNTTTETITIDLYAPVTPVITQVGDLCPGGTAVLGAGAGYDSYQWSTGDLTQTTTISAAGNYLLTVTDNGCEKIVSYQAVALSGPTARITSPHYTTICINAPGSPLLIFAQTQPGYTYQWYCNGTLQATTVATFVHTNTNVVGTFSYEVVVTNGDGCIETSNVIIVSQIECVDGNPDPLGCQIPYVLDFDITNATPNCNVGLFDITLASPNVNVTDWDFGEFPVNNINDGNLFNAIHTFSEAGCFIITVSGVVTSPAGTTCNFIERSSICIPLAADFSYAEHCGEVAFTDLSTYLPEHDINGWSWDFGDGNTSTAQHPVHTYAAGNYTVTLTVSNSGGCEVTISQNITVIGNPTPALTANPNPTCVGMPMNFTGTESNIIDWLWDFGDGASNGNQDPSHTYTTLGTYTVTLTVINEQGCIGTETISVNILPALPAGTITFLPSLEICEGETTTLSAPTGTGYTYLWNTGQTTQSINVGTTGTYSVTITDGNDCELILDPVTVTVYPVPEAYITGDLFICDDGCVTLNAPLGFGYIYWWLDDTGNPILGQNGPTMEVCADNVLPSYSVLIRNNNGCEAKFGPVTIKVELSPSFTIMVDPNGCEGTLNTLTINPVQSGVTYTWSTGEAGTVINVLQAGIYTAIGTDTLTGCTGIASEIINPLPDLCLVPVGCYEICKPDTICAPDGLAAYQWNLDGLPIADETGQCIIITESGTYSFTGTTEFGCELTTEDLMLEVINCDCEGLSVTVDTLENCCYAFTYDNNFSGIFGIMVHTDDADFDIDLAEIPPVLSVYTIGENWIGLVNSTPGQPLPGGVIDDFLTVCLSDVTSNPQQIIFDWYDFDFEIVCTDSLLLDCPVEPACLYMATDSIYCDGNEIIYELTVCNPIDNDFSIEYVQIVATSPVGVVVTPSGIDLSGSPIAPGTCENLSVVLTGAGLANEEFCYKLIAHEFDPAVVDTALCCSFDTTYCIQIPDCDPCDDIRIEGIGNSNDDECCYDVLLYNNYDANYFDGIGLCMLTPNASMTINNPFGSGWTTSTYSPAFIDLDVTFPIGSTIPLGTVALPTICIETTDAAIQLVGIKWMRGDEIVCRDTIEFRCEPACAYVKEDITCISTGWNYNGSIINTSDFVMSEAHFVFTSPAGMSIYNQVVTLGTLLPGGNAPFNFNIGAPAVAGDTICYTLALHEEGHGQGHVNCCNIHHCFVLPECDDQGIVSYKEPTVLPNPSSGIFDLVLPVEAEGEINIQLYDIHNIRLEQFTTKNLQAGTRIPMDISTHVKGVYIVVIETGKARWVKRVVVQ